MPSIGKVVARLRRRRGLSQMRVQELSGKKINAGWLASLETDKIKNPPQDKLELLAGFLGTTVLDIYKEAGIVNLPFPEGADPDDQRILALLHQMTEEEKRKFLEFLEARYPTPDEATPGEREREDVNADQEQPRQGRSR